MIGQMARAGAGGGHRALLRVWRYLPLSLRRVAIRILYPRFPVGAVAIICDEAGHVLLVRQTYHRGGERWGAPGGWLGRGETPPEAAIRETLEETGLRVRAGRVLAVGGGPYGEISLAFECQIMGQAEFRPSDETDQIGYFERSALPLMTTNTRLLLVQALAARERWREAADVRADPVPADA